MSPDRSRGSAPDPAPARVPGAPTVALRETCRVVAGPPFPEAVPLWPWHRARLAAGGCGAAVLAASERAAAEAIGAYAGPAGPRIRLTVVARPDGSVRASCQRRLSSLDVPGGPVVALVSVQAPPALPAGPAKPADRSAWDAAQSQAVRLGAHQALLVGPDDALIAGGTATLWLVSRGVLVTPPSPPAIPGVARAWLLERVESLGLSPDIRRVVPEDLDLAEGVFLTNAFAGAVAVRGRCGSVTGIVHEAFVSLWS